MKNSNHCGTVLDKEKGRTRRSFDFLQFLYSKKQKGLLSEAFNNKLGFFV